MIELTSRIKLKIQPSFWIVAGLLSWLINQSFYGTLLWVLILFFSIIVHELGHALTLTLFNRSSVIQVSTFGGSTEKKGPALSLKKEILVAGAGPLSSLFFSGLFCLGSLFMLNSFIPFMQAWHQLFLYVSITNLFWACLNLIPIPPLDGWWIMEKSLELLFGVRGIRVAYGLSALFCILATCFFIYSNWHLPTLLMFLLGFQTILSWKSTQNLTEHDRSTHLRRMYKKALKTIERKDFETAYYLLEEIISQTKEGILFEKASQELAYTLSIQGRYQEALDCLLSLKKTNQANTLTLLHQLAYKLEKFDLARELSSKAYIHKGDAATAVINAISYAENREKEPTLGWIKCAKRHGYVHWDFLKEKRFSFLSHDKEFNEFLQSISRDS